MYQVTPAFRLGPPPARNELGWEYRTVVIARSVSRSAARQLLSEQAEREHWVLDRVRRTSDGTRRVVLRRRVLRVVETADFGS